MPGIGFHWARPCRYVRLSSVCWQICAYRIESTRWLVYHAAWLADTQPPEKLRVPAAQVRLASGELLKRAVDSTTMVFLGPGPSAQIEPRRLVHSVIPMDALEQGLEQARAVIANQMLNLSQV